MTQDKDFDKICEILRFTYAWSNPDRLKGLDDIIKATKSLIRSRQRKNEIMEKPFTDKEEKVMNLLAEAHNNFIELERTHPMEITEWVSNFHKLQDLLGARVLRRDYPETFTSI